MRHSRPGERRRSGAEVRLSGCGPDDKVVGGQLEVDDALTQAVQRGGRVDRDVSELDVLRRVVEGGGGVEEDVAAAAARHSEGEGVGSEGEGVQAVDGSGEGRRHGRDGEEGRRDLPSLLGRVAQADAQTVGGLEPDAEVEKRDVVAERTRRRQLQLSFPAVVSRHKRVESVICDDSGLLRTKDEEEKKS